MGTTPELWIATYQAKTTEELADAYDEWAGDYDRDTLEAMGYVGPHVAVEMLDYHLDSKTSRVLDAGCGTGLVGEHLHRMGYRNVDAIDYSRAMLDEAEKKEVYHRLYRKDMNLPLDLPDNHYDATICVGTFTYAHVGPHVLDELVRVTRPDGFICFTIRDGVYKEHGYREKMLKMEASDKWQLEALVEHDYLRKEDVSAKFCTYRVLED